MQTSELKPNRTRAWIAIAVGIFLVLVGFSVAAMAYSPAARGAGLYVICYGPVVLGATLIALGLASFVPTRSVGPIVLARIPGVGYKSFVAWRYLLIYNHRVTLRTKIALTILLGLRLVLWLGFGVGIRIGSWWDPLEVLAVATSVSMVVVMFWGILRFSKLSEIVFVVGVVIGGGSVLFGSLVDTGKLPFITLGPDARLQWLQITGITMLGGFALAGLAAFFGTLRGFFTFFTTVPIGGVWIGTAALVMVLAVMSGFESDLRDKILGSNAHIQITREDGEFVNWRQAKAEIDKIPGVVASTPFAVSEVVIAANNNGQNVIIKGIDPATVGNVTDLVSDLEDRDAMKRLAPLIDATHDRVVPQVKHPSGGLDPMPDDMPSSGDPIDFSGDDSSGSASGSAGSGAGSNAGSAGSGSATRPTTGAVGNPDVEPVTPYGGDASRIIDLDAPPPRTSPIAESDLVRWMVGDDSDEPSNTAVRVIDMPLEPSLSRRTQALPGILVGRELVKQTHLYTGQEVRVVSPLSDPSNPDATGTPIPFNRDYRVAGIFYTGMYEYDLKYVYVSLDSLQDFLDRGDSIDGIEVRIDDPDDTGRYVPTDDSEGLIRERLGPGYRVQDWRELNRSLFSALKLEKIAMFLVLGIVILVASFSIVGNLIMVVVEKAREIALLKTLGASNWGVMQLFAIQGLFIGIIGTTLGVATGLAGCWLGKEFGLPLNPDVYYIDRLPIHVDPQSVAAAAAAGVLISIMATLYPALLAARVRPAAGMRH